jgi:hypothetical protein
MRVSGIARRLGIDRNPLRRPTDRIETWLTAVVLVAAIGLGPVLAWHAAAGVYSTTAASATQDQRERFQVTAVLQEDTNYSTYDDGVQLQQAPVPARWTAPDGTPRTGLVVPTAAVSAGTSIVIETDANGTPLPPAVGQDHNVNALLTALLVLAGVAAVASLLIILLRHYLDKIRMGRWQRDWLLFEPTWGGRR